MCHVALQSKHEPEPEVVVLPTPTGAEVDDMLEKALADLKTGGRLHEHVAQHGGVSPAGSGP